MRPTLRRTIAGATAALLTIAFAPAVEQTQPGSDDPHSRSESIEYVANLRHDEAVGDEADVDEQGGTDLEVVRLTVAAEDGGTEERTYAINGTYENGLNIVDVTDPANPVRPGGEAYGCNVRQGDIQVWTVPSTDGSLDRTFSTFAIENGGTNNNHATDPCIEDLTGQAQFEARTAASSGAGGSLVIELTDPANPRTVGFIPTGIGSHNGTVRGFDLEGDDGSLDTWLFYNSASEDTEGVAVWDLTGMDDGFVAEKLHTVAVESGSNNAHDITFNEAGDRAYVASITHSYIMDTSDPLQPSVLTLMPDPAVGIHHQADPITIDGSTYVIISDEIAGAAGNGYCPGGGMHVWDVTNETAPVKVGAYFMPDVAINEGAHTGAGGVVTSCTAHVYDIYPEQQLMTIGNMAGGVRVIDLSNLVGVSVGHDNTSTANVTGTGMVDLGWFRFSGTDETGSDSWAFKALHDDVSTDEAFHVFSNDQTRGFEVYRFDPTAAAAPAEGAAERGSWVSPNEALRRFEQLKLSLSLDDEALLFSCRFANGVPAGQALAS